MLKKRIFIVIFSLFCTLYGFSEAPGLVILKNSDLSFDVPFAFTAGDLKNYASADYGYQVKIASKLADFNSGNISLGLCTTLFYNDYLFKREEIQSFFVRGFTEGFWVENALPAKFLLRNEISAGMGFTYLKAEGIEHNKIEGDYNSLVIGVDSTVSRVLFDTPVIAFGANAGIDVKIICEKETVNAAIGIMAGITVKAGKKWR